MLKIYITKLEVASDGEFYSLDSEFPSGKKFKNE